MTRIALLTLVALALGTGCASTPTPFVAAESTAATTTVASPADAMTIEVKAPPPVPYVSTVLGLSEIEVAVRVTNHGARPARMGDVRVAFDVEHDGVRFACFEQRPTRAPDALEPGEAFTAHAMLRCWTPLVGSYAARAFVRLGDGATARVLPFRFDVEDPTHVAARTYPWRPELRVLAGGAFRTLPVPDETPDDLSYHAVLVLVNAGTRPMTLPPARVTLEVYRKGDALPCTTQLESFPIAPMAAGAVTVEHVPVTCLRDRPGVYDVHVLVGFDEGVSVEAGRLQVRVTNDLGVIVPFP